VTSPTARRLPLARIVPELRARQVVVLVDGAQAPGLLDLQLDDIGADYYTGDLHKWTCAPRGTAVLHARAGARHPLRPLVASWQDARGFPDAFRDTGTKDLTAWLAAGRALRTLEHLGFDRLRRHNAALCIAGQRVVAHSLGDAAQHPPQDPEVSMQLGRVPWI